MKITPFPKSLRGLTGRELARLIRSLDCDNKALAEKWSALPEDLRHLPFGQIHTHPDAKKLLTQASKRIALLRKLGRVISARESLRRQKSQTQKPA
jgi:hypothetical protein